MRPWILAETNYAYTKQHDYEVAVLPLGATEPHNLHLPYATDLLEGTVIGEHVCEAAHQQGATRSGPGCPRFLMAQRPTCGICRWQ